MRAKHHALVCSVDIVECVALLCCALYCMAVLCYVCVCVRCSEQLCCVICWSAVLSGRLCCALVCLASLCCALEWERNEWKANPKEKIYVGVLCHCNCVVLQPCCAVLRAMCMQLGDGHVLLCAAVRPVCSCALVCFGVCVCVCCTSLLCAVLHGLAVLCVCCVRMDSCAVWVAGLPCFQGNVAVHWSALPCPAVRWSRIVIPNREDLGGWPKVCHHAVCTRYPKVIQFRCHVESILRPWTDLG